MTQYVKKFPLPPLEAALAQKIIKLVGDRITDKMPNKDREMEIDQLVWESFGLVEEACGYPSASQTFDFRTFDRVRIG